MKLLKNQDIDKKKWDKKIAASSIENIFLYSWYLDAVSSGWMAIVEGDYETIFPVPFSKKVGIQQMIQAKFTREYDIVGDSFTYQDVVKFLATDFKAILFRNGEDDILPEKKTRKHQWLNLTPDFKNRYSTNTKRILKKTKNFSITVGMHPKLLLDLFKEFVAHKIESLSETDLQALERLMIAAIKLKKAELLLVHQDDTLVAAGIFLFDKSRVTYLKGASTEKSKKDGVMYYMMDFALTKYAAKFDTFDFGGSDIQPVADFYHKFGAEDRTYYEYVIDDLPFWFKTLKKLKP